MSRRRSARHTVEISLFPFLAVLICTMGALIVLFVVMVLQARTEAVAVDLPALSVPAPVEPELPAPAPEPEPVEDYTEQMKELEQLRVARLKQLEEARLQLSGLEDHSHRLTEKIRKLRGDIAVLEGETENVTGSADDFETQKQRLNQQIAEAQTELEKVRQEIKGRKPAYALVPYDGQSGTRRQPIYIECTADRVIIQPEGIGLTGIDFQEPLGPGNPLAASLRTIREYRQSQGVPGQGNPYPLLIVRPGGAESYAAAREALNGWDDEFGYELVDEDTELAYPPADRFLAKRLIETVELARRRKIELVMAAPKKYGRIEDQYLTATRNGGFQAVGGGGGDDEEFLENRFVERGNGNGDMPAEAYGGSGQMGTGRATSPVDGTQQKPPQQQLSSAFYPQQAPPELRTGEGKHGVQYAQPNGPDQKDASGGTGGNRSSAKPIAATRGGNWALPSAGPKNTAITRPVTLVVSGEQMTLVQERGVLGPAETVPVNGDMEAAVDKLVRLIHTRIDSWGMAGRNFYWKPILQITVEQGGEPVVRQLETLLYGSGIEVNRK
ncbi:hypothetical protein C5Y96_04700 [Blastopirellula marina]|uniref:Uncharacterized protein n=1 Tax=Blastopirellula marina TaxID=124 RepID=A0A2S8G3Z1_9BACT|nr:MULTISPECIES: hypothetical protein [Pirellulaceae]PQO39166.1 hypothetical protein C5Y96_04700 [Blastopirellula marina]RCS55474.1 hypothetical protein DTL36_04710 [Bremerella cremea]